MINYLNRWTASKAVSLGGEGGEGGEGVESQGAEALLERHIKPSNKK